MYSDQDRKNLSLMSLIFCSLSSICLVFTVVVYISVKSLRNRRNIFTCNLAVCLLCMNILVVTGLKRVDEIKCLVISGLLQYCVLASFVWMFLEGVLLYKMVITVFERSRIRLPIIYGMAYGIPFVIVAASSSIIPDQMVRDQYCWPSPEKGLVWSVIGPIVIIITVNLIIFAMTLNAAFKVDKMNPGNKSMRQNKPSLIVRLKGMFSLTCLLGLSWIVGFFYVPNNSAPTAYLFVTLNGLQGFFLFLTQIILNTQVREKLFLIYKENMARLTATISTKNSVSHHPKEISETKKPISESSIVFTDISPPSKWYNCDKIVYPTTPSPEKPSSKTSSYDEEWRHPFEIDHEAKNSGESPRMTHSDASTGIIPTKKFCYDEEWLHPFEINDEAKNSGDYPRMANSDASAGIIPTKKASYDEEWLHPFEINHEA